MTTGQTQRTERRKSLLNGTCKTGWHQRLHGEPSLRDVLADPIVHLMMERDQVSFDALRSLINGVKPTLTVGRG